MLKSKVFSVNQQVALSQDDVSSVTELILLSHIGHIEILLVKENKLRLLSVQVGAESKREERPHDEFLCHNLSDHHACESGCHSIDSWSNVAIIHPFATSNVGPVSLNRCSILMGLPVKYVVSNEHHPQVNRSLVVLWNASVVLVEVVKVILV